MGVASRSIGAVPFPEVTLELNLVVACLCEHSFFEDDVSLGDIGVHPRHGASGALTHMNVFLSVDDVLFDVTCQVRVENSSRHIAGDPELTLEDFPALRRE